MIEIRNLQFQPLTFQLGTEGSLHLGPRQKKSIARKDLSAEIQTAAKRGLVRITDMTGGAEPEPEKPPATEGTGSEETKVSQPKRRK